MSTTSRAFARFPASDGMTSTPTTGGQPTPTRRAQGVTLPIVGEVSTLAAAGAVIGVVLLLLLVIGSGPSQREVDVNLPAGG